MYCLRHHLAIAATQALPIHTVQSDEKKSCCNIGILGYPTKTTPSTPFPNLHGVLALSAPFSTPRCLGALCYIIVAHSIDSSRLWSINPHNPHNRPSAVFQRVAKVK